MLGREGIAGVSMRAVAREAGVALGLASYHFENKTELISAALRQIGTTDMELVTPTGDGAPAELLRRSLHRAMDAALLTPHYLSLRLQLWSLAGVDSTYADINRSAQQRYLDGLAELVATARPDLADDEVRRRSADILTVQNGVWLTAILIDDEDAVHRALARCEAIAFG